MNGGGVVGVTLLALGEAGELADSLGCVVLPIV